MKRESVQVLPRADACNAILYCSHGRPEIMTDRDVTSSNLGPNACSAYTTHNAHHTTIRFDFCHLPFLEYSSPSSDRCIYAEHPSWKKMRAPRPWPPATSPYGMHGLPWSRHLVLLPPGMCVNDLLSGMACHMACMASSNNAISDAIPDRLTGQDLTDPGYDCRTACWSLIHLCVCSYTHAS